MIQYIGLWCNGSTGGSNPLGLSSNLSGLTKFYLKMFSMSFLEELKKKMDERKSPVTVINRGVTPLSLLGIAFIVLKVMGQITWSWWWVLAPFWIPVVIAVSIVFFVLLLLAIIAAKEQKVTVEVEAPKKRTRTKKTKKDDGAGVEGKNE